MKQEDRLYIESLTDKEIVEAILRRDAKITRLYLYEMYYPLFKARYDKYYTDCESCLEFINEIYVYIMTPGVKSGKCYLASFGYSCRFEHWLKIVVENYCHQLYKKKPELIDTPNTPGDRKTDSSTTIDIESLNQADVNAMLNLMRNKRYRDLIRYRYVEEESNEETAELLGMSMDNYYNKHKLAKEQFTNVLKKEGLI
jgi:RNA polymerase sigma factor (sigma-70 family)